MKNEIEAETQSIFYEIMTPNGKKSYLLATLHVNVNVLTQFPQIGQALEESQACIFESDTQSTKQEEITASISNWNLTHQDHEMDKSCQSYKQSAKGYLLQTLIQKLGLQAYSIDLDEILSQQTPIRIANQMIMETIDPSKRTTSLDAQLIEQAKIKNKPLFYLESIEEQYKLSFGLDLNYEEHLEYYHFVSDSIKNNPDFMSIDSTLQFYQTQDMEGLKKRHLANLENKPIFFKQYFQTLINDRDATLTERMISYLEEGGAFIAVGALHITGIIENLKSQNYRITPISLPNKTEKLHELAPPRLIELSPQNETVDSNFNKNQPIPPHRRVMQEYPIYCTFGKSYSDEEFITEIQKNRNNTTWLKIEPSSHLRSRSVNALEDAFSEIPKNVNSLIFLHFKRQSDKKLSDVLANIPPHVDFIDLNRNQLSKKKAEDLAQDFKSLPPYVTAISLTNNFLQKISVEGLRHLKDSLPHIKFLYLSVSEVKKMTPPQREEFVKIFPNVKEVFFLYKNRFHNFHYQNPLGNDVDFSAAEFCIFLGFKVNRVPSLLNHCGFFIHKKGIDCSSLPKDLEYFVNFYKS